jgi:hypothetical protein
VDIVAESVTVKNVPDDAALEKCHNLGEAVAAELLKRVKT